MPKFQVGFHFQGKRIGWYVAEADDIYEACRDAVKKNTTNCEIEVEEIEEDAKVSGLLQG